MTTRKNRHPEALADYLGNIRTDWDYCAHCGHPLRFDDVDTACDPKKVTEYKRYLQRQKMISDIECRMNERQRKFEAAQAADKQRIYELRNK